MEDTELVQDEIVTRYVMHEDDQPHEEEEEEDDQIIQVPLPESHLRSLIKGVSYRIVSSLATITISYVVIGNVDEALKIGFVEFFAKILIYYLHERLWAHIKI